MIILQIPFPYLFLAKGAFAIYSDLLVTLDGQPQCLPKTLVILVIFGESPKIYFILLSALDAQFFFFFTSVGFQ